MSIGNKPQLRYLIFYVTSRCNMRCEHCFYIDELNKHDEMSLDELERVARSVNPLTFIRVTGGEPFLRKDMPEAISMFYQHAGTRRMGIITNGSRAAWVEKAVARIYELCPELDLDIGVSIDGLQETHDAIRKLPGAFERAKETVQALLMCKERFPRLRTSLVMTVTARNVDELDALYDEVSKWGVDRLSVNHVRGKLHDPSLLEVPYKIYQAFAQRCEQYHLVHERGWKASVQRAKNRMTREAIEEVVRGDSSRVACLAGSAIGVLYSDGEVNLCEMLEEPNSAVNGTPASKPQLGNVRDVDYDFYRVWHSENTQHCREWIRHTNCSCSHECFLTASILFGKRNYPKLAHEWLKLSMARD